MAAPETATPETSTPETTSREETADPTAEKLAEDTATATIETDGAAADKPWDKPPPDPAADQPIDAVHPLKDDDSVDYKLRSDDEGAAEARDLEAGDRLESHGDADKEDLPDSGGDGQRVKSGNSLIWTVAVILIIAAVGYFTWPSWSPHIAGYIPESIRNQSWFPAIPGQTTETVAVEPSDTDAASGQPTTGSPPDLTAAPDETQPVQSDDGTADGSPQTETGVADEAQPLERDPDTADSGTLGGTAATAPSGAASGEISGMVARLATLEQQLATLNREVVALRSGMPTTSSPETAASLENTAQRLQAVEATLTATQESLDGQLAAVQETIAAQQERLNGLETRTLEMQTAATTVLAISQLEVAAAAGQDFSAQLATLKNVVGDDAEAAPAIATLEDHAGGVPTFEALKEAFPGVRYAVARTDPATGEEGDWKDLVYNTMRGLVVYKSPDDAEPDSGGIEGAIDRAEIALEANDLNAAVSALDGISGPQPVSDWLSDATSRLAVDQSMAHLREQAITRLTVNAGT